MRDRLILSLFDYSGTWSQPYVDAGYRVIRIDLKRSCQFNGPGELQLPNDVLRINRFFLADTGPVHGILAAPPCTDFAGSGAQYWNTKDADGRTQKSKDVVNHALDIVRWVSPHWWCLENPVGRLNKVVPWLAQFGPRYFQPYHYGDPYTKKTGLWGQFTFPEPTNIVQPERVCSQGSWVQKLGGKSERTKELRSITPKGFAQAFFENNP